MHNIEVSNEIITCAWCGRSAYLEWIHGRGQCSSCKVILDEDFRVDWNSFGINSAEESTTMNDSIIILPESYLISVLKNFAIPN